MNFDKQDIAKTALVVWLMISTLYVLYDLYDNYRVKGTQAAYKQGYADSVADVITKVGDADCQPIEIRKEDRSVEVMAAECRTAPVPFPSDTVPSFSEE